MREFKFRLFELGEMEYFTFDDVYYNRVVVNNGVTKTPIMQYTGLKDKNGKEIYEGDIIQCKSEVKGEVYWAENWAMWSVCGEALMRNTDGELIGNKYEHPELL